MVVYDSQVKQQIEEYDISLKSYPISAYRRKEKVRKLRQFLQSIGKNALSYPVCDSKKLGQAFNAINKPIDASLRQAHYQDESGTQWRISFLQVSPKVVKIYRLIQSKFVDESIRKTIRFTESQFKSLLTECLMKIINKIG